MARGPKYWIDIRHDGLNKSRHISGYLRCAVEAKASTQEAIWEEQWEKKCAAQARRDTHEAKKDLATERTKEAQQNIIDVKGILAHTLDIDNTIDWDSLKSVAAYSATKPLEPEPTPLPSDPQPHYEEFQPKLGLLDRLIPSLRAKKEQAATTRFDERKREWEEQTARIQTESREAQHRYRSACAKWQAARRKFDKENAAHNRDVDDRRAAYERAAPHAIEEYCDLVLSNSNYPDSFPCEFEVEYRPDGKIALVDYQLPSPDALPGLNQVKYVQSRDEFTETSLSGAAFHELYDNCLYQIALRTIHELLEADQINAIEIVLFNGWVRSIDKATGQETTGCIVSLQASKQEFTAINLAQVDPKACFRSLRGVGSARLHGLTPVRPILELSKDDSRFIGARAVAEGLSEGDNLAAMDWEDFEHLIREVFEQEFAQGGGEVKITQASRDRGVDAVAFDPDPIRGGKIVIQAKRYTNTVGVSAVRDLYGTVMNEGAMKGILVCTSNYGPDAYAFVRDKPLTLLSGANLLHMLERHGHKARIDLREAKELLTDQ